MNDNDIDEDSRHYKYMTQRRTTWRCRVCELFNNINTNKCQACFNINSSIYVASKTTIKYKDIVYNVVKGYIRNENFPFELVNAYQFITE